MPSEIKTAVIDELRRRFGEMRKVGTGGSLFVIGDDAARIYFRYSRVHERGRTFFGLRQIDLRQLEGHNAYLCFLIDDGSQPLFVPYADFEDVFANSMPANDGQYKVQLLSGGGQLELYIARQGRFNVEGYVGPLALERSMESHRLRDSQNFSHCQIQTLLAGIGNAKGYQVYVPQYDVGKLDWALTARFGLSQTLPHGFEDVKNVLGEVDVIWVSRHRGKIEGLFEVEHSTAVYSGLLRFNDVLLTDPRVTRFSIVSNELRRSLFARQLFRPTFRKSGLADVCSFLEYANVAAWHQRIRRGNEQE